MSGRVSLSARTPGTVLSAAALAAAVATAALLGTDSPVALACAAVGVVGFTVGLSADDRRVVGVGALALLGGVLAAGAAGAPTERLLPATAAAVLAWEFGAGSFDLGSELRGGTGQRREVTHVAAATVAAAVVAGLTYAFSRSVTVGPSTLGATLLLVATVALGLALRE